MCSLFGKYRTAVSRASSRRKINIRVGPGQLVTHRLTCAFAKSALVASGPVRVLPQLLGGVRRFRVPIECHTCDVRLPLVLFLNIRWLHRLPRVQVNDPVQPLDDRPT